MASFITQTFGVLVFLAGYFELIFSSPVFNGGLLFFGVIIFIIGLVIPKKKTK